MRGVIQEEMRPEVSKAVFSKMVELTSDSQFTLAAVCEYFCLSKIASVSNSDTAFNNRGMHQNILCTCVFQDGTPENLKIAREKTHRLTDLIAGNEKDADVSKTRSYGNYGMCCANTRLIILSNIWQIIPSSRRICSAR